MLSVRVSLELMIQCTGIYKSTDWVQLELDPLFVFGSCIMVGASMRQPQCCDWLIFDIITLYKHVLTRRLHPSSNSRCLTS